MLVYRRVYSFHTQVIHHTGYDKQNPFHIHSYLHYVSLHVISGNPLIYLQITPSSRILCNMEEICSKGFGGMTYLHCSFARSRRILIESIEHQLLDGSENLDRHGEQHHGTTMRWQSLPSSCPLTIAKDRRKTLGQPSQIPVHQISHP